MEWPGNKLQPAPPAETLAERIRREREIVVTCRSGNVFRLVRPTPQDLLVCGLSTIPYISSIARKAALEQAGQPVPKKVEEEVAKALAELESNPARAEELLAAQDRLFARIFLEPRFFAGHYADTPPNSISRGHLGPDLDDVQAALGMTPDGQNGGEAALAVERFREEPGGAPPDAGGEVLPGEALATPEG